MTENFGSRPSLMFFPTIVTDAAPNVDPLLVPPDSDGIVGDAESSTDDGPALQREALTLGHIVTRRPKNPYCKICARARVRQAYHKRGDFRRELHARGDLAIADHVDRRRSEMIT